MMQNRKKQKLLKAYISCKKQLAVLHKHQITMETGLIFTDDPKEADFLLFPLDNGRISLEQAALLDEVKSCRAVFLDEEKLSAGDFSVLRRGIEMLEKEEALEKETQRNLDYGMEL